MAVQTAGAATALLKRVYGPRIHDQLNNEALLFSLLKRGDKETYNGSNFIEAMRTGRNRSAASGGEETAIPTAQRQTFNNWTIDCKQYRGAGGITAFGVATTQLAQGAFERMFRAEVDGMIADAKKDLNVDFYGLESGVLGRITNDPGGAATLLQLENAQNLIGFRSHGNRYLSPGMALDIMDVDGASVVLQTGLSVASVDSGTRTNVTMDGNVAAGVGIGDLICRTGSYNTAFTGLESLIDDTTTVPAAAAGGGADLSLLQAIDRDTSTFARSTVLDKAGAALAESDLQNLIYAIEEKSGIYPEYILTHRSVQQSILNLMTGDRRFVPQVFPGGFKADSLVYNAGDRDIPIIVDRECPYDRLYVLHSDCITNYVLRDVELAEEDGSVLRQGSTGGNANDTWTFFWRLFANMGTRQPNGLGKMVRIGGADEVFGTGAARLYDF
jgi:hypothetical protein